MKANFPWLPEAISDYKGPLTLRISLEYAFILCFQPHWQRSKVHNTL